MKQLEKVHAKKRLSRLDMFEEVPGRRGSPCIRINTSSRFTFWRIPKQPTRHMSNDKPAAPCCCKTLLEIAKRAVSETRLVDAQAKKSRLKIDLHHMPWWIPQRSHSTSDGINKRGKWKTEMARVSWPCSVQLIRCLLLWTLSEHQWTIWSEGCFRVAPNYVAKAYDSGLWYMYPNGKVLPSNCEGWLTGETPRPKKGLSPLWQLSRAKPQVFNCQVLGSEEIAGLQNRLRSSC